LGFGGAATYTRALQIRRLVTQLPLSSLVTETDAPDMPYGFFVDIPPQGVLGAYAQDLSVHAWWLLANLSGQIPIDVDAFLASGLLPDTGPDGYLQRLTAVEAWQDAVINRLGGQTLLDSGFVVALLTQPSPIADLALELTMAIKQVNEVTAEAELPTRQGGKS
jgi:hypothetical protein